MNIARLRDMVDIYSFENDIDDYGGAVQRWTKIASVYAEVKGIRGEEFRTQVFTDERVAYSILIRYTDNIFGGMIAKNRSDGRVYNILAARDPNGKREVLELTCTYRADKQSLLDEV